MITELAIVVVSVTVLLALIAAVFKLGNWYGQVNSDRVMFKEFMTEIRKDINNILSRLPPLPTAGASPIHLTDLGERISKHVGATNWAEGVAPELVGQTEGMNPYEIQTMSFDYAKKFEPDEALLAKMQQSAFETGLDLEGVRSVLGVELRDRLLQLNNLL